MANTIRSSASTNAQPRRALHHALGLRGETDRGPANSQKPTHCCVGLDRVARPWLAFYCYTAVRLHPPSATDYIFRRMPSLSVTIT